MTFNFMIPLRIAQGTLALIVLALDAYVASWYNSVPNHSSPSEVNFLIATSVFTLCIALVYLTVFPKFLPHYCHRYAILAIEIFTMLFWFGGFVAFALFMSGQGICRGAVCMSARAGVAISAFEWVLFASTTVMAIIYVFRTRDSSSPSRTAKVMETTTQTNRTVV